MEDVQIAILAVKLDALADKVDSLRKELLPIVELATRHDERISDMEERGKWGGGILAACLVYVLTRVGLHLPG